MYLGCFFCIQRGLLNQKVEPWDELVYGYAQGRGGDLLLQQHILKLAYEKEIMLPLSRQSKRPKRPKRTSRTNVCTRPSPSLFTAGFLKRHRNSSIRRSVFELISEGCKKRSFVFFCLVFFLLRPNLKACKLTTFTFFGYGRLTSILNGGVCVCVCVSRVTIYLYLSIRDSVLAGRAWVQTSHCAVEHEGRRRSP